MINISLVGIGYWGSNILRELRQVDGVGDIEEIDIKDGKDIDSVTLEEYQKIISINLTGVFLGIKH